MMILLLSVVAAVDLYVALRLHRQGRRGFAIWLSVLAMLTMLGALALALMGALGAEAAPATVMPRA